MIINHNLNAMNAHRNMGATNISQGKAMEKLNSGLRINRSADDAAGLAISEKMRSQIRGLSQGSRNAQDGISMIQTAEGALSETHSISQRMRELAIQSANGTYTDEDRKIINQEFNQLKHEIDRIAIDTEFNGIKVLNGSISGKELKSENGWHTGISNGVQVQNLKKIFDNPSNAEEFAKIGEGTFYLKIDRDKSGNTVIDLIDQSHFNGGKEYILDSIKIGATKGIQEIEIGGAKLKLNDLDSNIPAGKNAKFKVNTNIEKQVPGVNLQVGANQNQTIGFSVDFMRSRELGLGGIEIDTANNAQEAIYRLDVAIEKVSAQRADLGATQNRLEHAIASVNNTSENLQAAESRIRDVDMAKEMMNLTKLNVLQQASQSMLAQANQAPQQVLSILK